MHRLLERQLRRHQIDPLNLSTECRTLLSEISDAYEQSDSDRSLMMRSLEIASQEQAARSHELQQRNRELAAAQSAASHIAAQLQMAVDGARIGIWSWNAGTGETSLSARFCHIFGIGDSETHPLERLISAIYPLDRPRFIQGLESAHTSHEFAQHVRLQHPTGELRWLRFIGKTDPATQWMHGIIRDVTDEVKGWHLRDTLAAIVNSANVAIASTDTEGRLLTWNDSAARLFGLTVNQIVGKHLSMIVAEADQDALSANIAIAEGGDTPPPLETTYRHPEGALLTLVLNISPIRDPHSAIEGFSIVVQDISARINAAKIQAERNALAASITKLEEAMAVVAHELRTPLAGIRATVELMLERSACMRTDNYLLGVLDSVVQTSRVVNDLLEITRLRSGNAMWHWETFELAAAMDAAVSCLGVAARNTTVQFQAIVDPPDMTMCGDQDAVTRLLVNLANNAFKFTTQGFVRVEITHEEQTAGVRYIHIVISDSGKGMSPETLQRLGEPFALNSGLVGESFTSGTGLGVAICKGIVDAHGGQIIVKSETQRGTTIDIRLRADLTAPIALKTSIVLANVSQTQEAAR